MPKNKHYIISAFRNSLNKHFEIENNSRNCRDRSELYDAVVNHELHL